MRYICAKVGRPGLKKKAVAEEGSFEKGDWIKEPAIGGGLGFGVKSLAGVPGVLKKKFGLLKSFGLKGMAVLLEALEDLDITMHAAADALLIHGEASEGHGLAGKALGYEGTFVHTFGKVGLGVDLGSEQVLFDVAGTVETPVGLGDAGGELLLMRTDGREAGNDGVAEGLGGGALRERKETELAGEAVAAGVLARTPLPFFGAGAGGVLGVAAVGFHTAEGDGGLEGGGGHDLKCSLPSY